MLALLTPTLLILTSCQTEEHAPTLLLEGPSHVHVERLGRVDGPHLMLADGSVPHGVIWTVSHPGVARVSDKGVVAERPGEVQVVAEWEEQRVEWTLVVELATVLTFVEAPAQVRVGDEVRLEVQARLGDDDVEVGRVEWASSNPGVIAVAGGQAVGVHPGTAYITATARGAQAMAELEVLP